ncbi:MAG: LysR substrate-binding domain-containing protein [Beijerinckiaceae bacterium]|jgi:DNA-binding transcriptional LysR family regulator|nr:LysR substrate-binding domain-containing protein [Beijerinckiaceae bacterium]
MAMTFKQLEAFHAVIATGSVTRAAAMLRVSQPAISRMLADLEASAGFPLFVRTARQLNPTERARALHAEVERSLVGLAQIEAVAKALRERGEGQLRLAVIPSLLSAVTTQMLAPFAVAHPSVSVSIEVAATLDALDWLGARQSDLGITYEPMRQPGIEARSIGTTEAACVVPRDHPLAGRVGPVGPADLGGWPFMSYRLDSSFRASVDRLFDEAAIRRDLRFEARTTAAVCELVAATGGVAIIPCPGPALVADMRLVLLPFRPQLSSEVLLIRASGPISPPARAFIDFIGSHRLDFIGALPSNPVLNAGS